MGVNGKDIQVCMMKTFKFSMRCCYNFVKTYPTFSCISLFLFFLYMFFPSVFRFLIYTSLVLVLAAIILRIFLLKNVDHPKKQNVGRDEKRNKRIYSRKVSFAEDDIIVDKHEHSSTQIRGKTRRKHAKEKDREDYRKTCVEEKGTVSSTRFNDDLVDKSALIDENPKDIREVEVHSTIDRSECSSSNASQILKPELRDGFDERSQKFNSGGSESSEDSEDEEEAKENGNKAVKWTEDDQKNLMDLGNSERERNRRLESLIARRRARKLLSFQVRKTLMNSGNNSPPSHLSSVLIPRNNPSITTNSGGQFSPTPGSAPSILIPMGNPFDLPYDPYEEKPNLMGDSFHQEFVAAHQRDMMFCRHESFSLGAFFPRGGHKQNRDEMLFRDLATKRMALERPASRLSFQPDKEDRDKQEQEPSQGEPILNIESAHDCVKQGLDSEQVFDLVDNRYEEDRGEEDRGEFQKKSMLVESTSVGSSSSSSSSEADGSIFRMNKDAILKSLARSVSNNRVVDREANGRINELSNNSSQSVFEERKVVEPLYYVDSKHHTPTQSIASDMQVEVSEVGSPPQTDDDNTSLPDEESSIYDDHGQKEITYGTEDMLVASSRLPGVDENESRLTELYENSLQDVKEVEFSGIYHKSNDSVGSDMLPEVLEQYSNNALSLSPEILVLPVVEEEAQHSTEKYVGHPSHDGDLKNPKEPSTPNTFNRKLNPRSYNVKDLDVSASNGIKDIESEAYILLKQGNAKDQSEINTSKAVRYNGEEYEKPSEHQETILESCKPTEDCDNLNSFADIEREYEKLPENLDMAVNAMTVENNDIQSLVHESEDEQGNAEVGFSMVSQTFRDPVALTVVPESVVEQVPIALSSSSSPTSVLQPKFSIDQASLSNIDQDRTTEVQQSNSEILENNSLDDLSREIISLGVPQNALHMVEYPAHPFCSTDCDEMQGPSDYEGKSTEEASNNYKLKNIAISQKEENPKSVNDIEGEQRTIVDCMESSGVNSSKSTEDDAVGDLKKLDEEVNVMGPTNKVEENENLGTIVEREEHEETIGHEDMYPPQPADAKHNLETTR